jgi:hypothetical protein
LDVKVRDLFNTLALTSTTLSETEPREERGDRLSFVSIVNTEAMLHISV